MNLKILNTNLLEDFKEKIDFSVIDVLNEKAEDESGFIVDFFRFYNSVSSIYSSKIEG